MTSLTHPTRSVSAAVALCAGFILVLGTGHGPTTLSAQTMPIDAPSYESLEAVIDAEYPEVAVPGDGRIDGTVTLSDRNDPTSREPVANLKLTILPKWKELPEDVPLEARVRNLIEWERFRRARRRETTTDANGAFAFTDLPRDAEYVIRTHPHDSYSAFSDRNGTSVGTTVPLVARKRTIAEHVLPATATANGLPVDEATIYVRTTNGRRSGTAGGKAGAVRVSDGTHVVWAEYRDLASAEVEITVSGGQPPALELEMHPVTRARGWIRDVDPMAMTVQLFARDAVEVGTARTELPTAIASTSARGALEFDRIEPGLYDAAVVTMDSVVRVWSIEIEPGFNWLSIEGPSATPDTLGIDLLLPPGADGTSRIAFVPYVNGRRHGRFSTDAGDRGDRRFDVTVPPMAMPFWTGRQEGELAVVLDVQGLGTRTVLVRRNQARVAVPFAPPAVVEFTIPAYLRSRFVGRLQATLTPNDPFGQPVEVTPNWRGGFTPIVVQPGDYTVTIHDSPTPSAADADQSVELPVQLSSGAQTVTLTLPR